MPMRQQGWGLMPEAQAEERHWIWQIHSLDDAYQMARESFGGILFLLLMLVGIMFEMLAVFSAPKAPSSDQISAIIGMLLTAAITAICIYRIRIGKGWIAGPVLVLLVAVELGISLTRGSLNAGGAMLQLGLLASIVMGAVACWQVRLREKRGEVRSKVEV
jgi:hypothetical protein